MNGAKGIDGRGAEGGTDGVCLALWPAASPIHNRLESSMNRSTSSQLAGHVLKSLSMGLAGLSVAAGAWAGAPVLSGPSIAKASAPAQFQGQGFAANTAVTVMVKAPGGASAGYSAVTGAKGELAYTLVATQTGAHTVTVTDSGGRALATATVAVLP